MDFNSNSYILFSIDPQRPGDKARLMTEYRGALPQCLTFWYHMYGSGVGTLKVFTQTSGIQPRKIGQDLFTQSGNKGDKWKVAHVTLPRALFAQVISYCFTDTGFAFSPSPAFHWGCLLFTVSCSIDIYHDFFKDSNTCFTA